MGKSLSEADADAQALLKEIMPLTQASLEAREGFRPMAATISQDGGVHWIEAEEGLVETGGEAAPVKEALTALRAQLRREAGRGAVRSTALAADVMIWRKQDGDEASNAVSVHVEHQSGYCVDLLIPYKVRRGLMSRLRKKPQVIFRKMIAQESEAVIFPAVAVERGQDARSS